MTMRTDPFSIALAFALPLAIAPFSTEAGEPTSPPPSRPQLIEESRSFQAKPGRWELEYRLRWRGEESLRVPLERVEAESRAWLGNSCVPGHDQPRLSTFMLRGDRRDATVELIASRDEVERCHEHAHLRVWLGEGADPGGSAHPADEPLEIAPGQLVHFWIALEHAHFLYGAYEPLLGRREIRLKLGEQSCVVEADLSGAPRDLAPASRLEVPPEERLDDSQYVSAPDSLHLEAHAPGCQYYRFRDQPVRYDTEMKLSFWYLVANGSQGCSRARLTQYQDGPGTSWTNLPRGGIEIRFETVGRWAYVERTFRTLPNATTVGLEFRIDGTDIGEAWIDDVRLDPLKPAEVTP